jgi:hypothetical protein
MTDSAYRPTVRTQVDLHEMWLTLMKPLGFATTRLYLAFVEGDGEVVPHLTEIDDLPEAPDEPSLDNLMGICAALLEHTLSEGSRPAVLLARPGPAGLTPSDRAWSTALVRAAQAHGVPLWPVHVAGDDTVLVVAPDDLAA